MCKVENRHERIVDHCSPDLMIHIVQVQHPSVRHSWSGSELSGPINKYHKRISIVDVLPSALQSKIYGKLGLFKLI